MQDNVQIRPILRRLREETCSLLVELILTTPCETAFNGRHRDYRQAMIRVADNKGMVLSGIVDHTTAAFLYVLYISPLIFIVIRFVRKTLNVIVMHFMYTTTYCYTVYSQSSEGSQK